MCERTCPNCGSTEHYEQYGLIGTYIGCDKCGLILALRRDIEAAPIEMTEEQATKWVKAGSFVVLGAEAKDPADDELFTLT